VPVIASLNGISNEGWTSYARQLEQAGANGLELNIYFIPADLTATGRDVEQRYFDILNRAAAVSIPIASSLAPISVRWQHGHGLARRGGGRLGTVQPVLSTRSRSDAFAVLNISSSVIGRN